MKGSEVEVHTEIEACRTCGIFFLTSSNFLRYLFNSDEPEMVHVRQELESWKVQLNENDKFPKYICSVCLLEFHRIFKFKNSCLETQQQLQQLYNIQQENLQNVQIKSETGEKITLKQEPLVNKPLSIESAFIYVDDLSDNDYDNDDSTTPKIPNLPLKQEVIEEAHIPQNERSPAKTPDLSMLALTSAKPTETNAIQQEAIQQEDKTAGIQCQHCLHISADQQKHRQHLLRIHETKPVECHICGKQFPTGTTETRLKYHMKWHRINRHIKCAQCGFHCPSRDVLNEHMRAVHTKIPCKTCGKHLFPKKMRAHMEKHRLTEILPTFQCPYCVNAFATNAEWNQHILQFHTAEIMANTQNTVSTEMNAQEITTQTKTETPLNVQSQNLNNSNEKSFEATKETEEENSSNSTMYEDYSGEAESYNNDDNVNESNELTGNEDLYNVEELSEEMLFSCAQCPESFAQVEQLIAHSKTHSKPKPFECNVCGKVFDLKFSLNRHLKRHKNTTL